MRSLHKGALLAGIAYLVIGVAFVFEALGYWTIRLTDVRLLLPAALVVIGIGVIIATVRRGNDQT